MSHKERMLAGELYLASDNHLRQERARAHRLARRYNLTSEDELGLRAEILGELFGIIGPGAEIEPPFYCDYGYNIKAGNGLYMNFGCVLLDCNLIELGDNVLLGPYVQIYAATHPVEPDLRSAGWELAMPVKIGNNVWIGGGAIIGPGVTIGDNCVIGAGSVVVRDVAANAVVAGNPARTIRAW